MLTISRPLIAILALFTLLVQSFPESARAAAPVGYWVNQSAIATEGGESTLFLTLAEAEIGATAEFEAWADGASANERSSLSVAVNGAAQMLAMDVSALPDGPVNWQLRLVSGTGEAGDWVSGRLSKWQGSASLVPSLAIGGDGQPLVVVDEAFSEMVQVRSAATDHQSRDLVISDSTGNCDETYPGIGDLTFLTFKDCLAPGLVELALYPAGAGIGQSAKLATYTLLKGAFPGAVVPELSGALALSSGTAVNPENQSAFAFQLKGVSSGARYQAIFSGGGVTVAIDGQAPGVKEDWQQVYDIQADPADLSGLPDGPVDLAVTLNDDWGNALVLPAVRLTKETSAGSLSAPTGYSASLSGEVNPAWVQVDGAEEGWRYDYRLLNAFGSPVRTETGVLGPLLSFALDLSALPEGRFMLQLSLAYATGDWGAPVSVSFEHDLMQGTIALHIVDTGAATQAECAAAVIQWPGGANQAAALMVQDTDCTSLIGRANPLPAGVPSVQFTGLDGSVRYCAFRQLNSAAAGYDLVVDACLPWDTDADGVWNRFDAYAEDAARPDLTSCLNDGSEVELDAPVIADQRFLLHAERIRTVGAVRLSGGANSATDVELVADASIRLGPGFHAEAGSQFRAAVLDCTAARPLARERVPEKGVSISVAPREDAPDHPRARRLGAGDLPPDLHRRLMRLGGRPLEAFADAAGRYVVFSTELPLTPYDRNGLDDVYLYSTADGGIALLSQSLNGGAGNGPSTRPRIDGAGALAVFVSAASDLTGGDDNGLSDVFLFDLLSRSLTRIPRPDANGDADHPAFGFAAPLVLFDADTPEALRDLRYFDPRWPQLGVRPLLPEAAHGAERLHPAADAAGRRLAYLELADAVCNLVLRDLEARSERRFACPPELLEPPALERGGLWLDADAGALNWCFSDRRTPDCVKLAP